jgi:hypothetical protein
MQHSADFTSFHAYQADVARAERAIEIRRSADERRALAAEQAPATSVTHRRRASRATRLATR